MSQLSFGQSKALSGVMNKIDYQNDTLKAVYDWVADNIKYDVAKLKQSEEQRRELKLL